MKFKNFEIKKAMTIFEPLDPNYYDKNFELVRWNQDYCFTIGFLRWNENEEDFEFESVGLRYFEYRESGLEEWIIAWCKLKKIELKEKEFNNFRDGSTD